MALDLASTLQDTQGHRRTLNGNPVSKPQQQETQTGEKRPCRTNKSIHNGKKKNDRAEESINDSTAVYGPYLDLGLNKQILNKIFELAGSWNNGCLLGNMKEFLLLDYLLSNFQMK